MSRPHRRAAVLVLSVLTVAGSLPACGPARAAQPAESAPEAPVAARVVAAPRPAKAVTVNVFTPPERLGGSDWVYFRETGHYLSGAFKTFFERNGGLQALGYPITEELVEDGWTVQYFQRARLELHPETPALPVQRALLGDMLLREYAAARDERGALSRRAGAPPAGARGFPETQAWIAPPVLEFFDRNGGVNAFGFPVAEPANGAQWFQRARLEFSGGAVQAALIGDEYTEVAGLAHARQRAQPPRLARADIARVQDDLPVLAAPGGSDLVTRLPQDVQLRVTGEQRAENGDVYFAVRLWGAVDGFVKPDLLAFSPAPDKAPGAAGTPWKPDQPLPQGPFPLTATARPATAVDFAAAVDGPAAGRLAAGAAVPVTAWATDPQGRPWYGFERSGAAFGWVLAELVSLDGGRQAAPSPAPLDRIAGKGMWFTYDTVRETPPQYLVAAARANGLTFLAPEVGTSRRGYWAGAEMDRLITAAHAAGLRVIPWVYPWLVDIPGDLQLALRAARHTTPSGETVDGLGVDMEEMLDEAPNRVFSELLRQSLGPQQLLVALTYQPQIASGRRTPFETLARSFDVIAPMSYWHARPIRYAGSDTADYVAESVRLIRERTGRPDLPVSVVGQTFDWFSRNEIGPNNPSGDEMAGALGAARASGALGIGFFNWFSTTPEEWDAVAAYGW